MRLAARIASLALVIALSVSSCAATPEEAAVPPPAPGKAAPGELVVMFMPETTEARRNEIHASAGGQVLSTMLGGRIAQVSVRQGQAVADLEAAYRGFVEVESVEPNYEVEAK